MTEISAPPPGTYAGGTRSPIAHVYLCPPCGGYQPYTPAEYWGGLSGRCQGCGSSFRELHRFPAVVNSVGGCACRTSHPRVTGDLTAASACAARVAELEDELTAANAALGELAGSHRPDDEVTPFCLDCGFSWPCPARRILDKVKERQTRA